MVSQLQKSNSRCYVHTSPRGSCIILNLPQNINQESSTAQAPKPQYLGDVSPSDQKLELKKAKAQDLSDFYFQYPETRKLGHRISECARFLEYRYVYDKSTSSRKYKLSNARFCYKKTCPVCQSRISKKWQAKTLKAIPQIIDSYPNSRWLFLTLTVQNCQINELRDTITWMNNSWRKLIRRKAYPGLGYIRSTEITRSLDGTAHPHFHFLILVDESYFSGTDEYLDHDEWTKLWRSSLKVDYDPMVNIQAVPQEKDPRKIVAEICKYMVKESDLLEDKDYWLILFTQQMAGLRTMSTSGVIKPYFAQVERDYQDLIHLDENEDEIEDHVLIAKVSFSWRTRSRRYLMTRVDRVCRLRPLVFFDSSSQSDIEDFKNESEGLKDTS